MVFWTRKRALAAVLLLAGSGLLFYGFRSFYDTSEQEATARSLVGKPVAQVREKLGVPNTFLGQTKFNSVERGNVRASFVPKEVPLATGDVFIYNLMPTIIIVYEERGIVREVYVGRS
jgi:hypothetical protein